MSKNKKALVFLSSTSPISGLRILYGAITARKYHSESDLAIFAYCDDEKLKSVFQKLDVIALPFPEIYHFEQCNFEGSQSLDEMNDFSKNHQFDSIFLKDTTSVVAPFLKSYDFLAKRHFLAMQNIGTFATAPKKIKKSCAFLQKKGIEVYDKTFLKVSAETQLWDMSVIGIPFLGINSIEKTIRMACRLSKKVKSDVFSPSLSFMLGQHGTIHEVKESFYAYEGFTEFDDVLKELFEKCVYSDRKEMFVLAEKIAVNTLIAPKIDFFRKNAFQKLILKLQKKHWQKPMYSWE